MNINKSYPCHSTNYRARRDSIKYIVIHYVGATGSALNNVKYYGGTPNIGASAHYYVGHASENGAIYQSVPPENCAWHCGSPSGKYYHPCRNDSSIGIEMCCHKSNDGTWYFDDITVEKTIELTKWLMKEYGISADNVIRHYDVTHKTCPAPFVLDEGAWRNFKNRLIESEESTMTQNSMIYNYVDDNMPEFARATIKKLVDKKILNGESDGLNLTYDMLRILVIVDRAGAFDK